jgi:hypothetical protein
MAHSNWVIGRELNGEAVYKDMSRETQSPNSLSTSVQFPAGALHLRSGRIAEDVATGVRKSSKIDHSLRAAYTAVSILLSI